MIEFYLTKYELEKALECLKEAEERGFVASEAVFRVMSVVPEPSPSPLTEELTTFQNQLILKADPEDPSKNWGRINREMIPWYRLVNGKVVDEY